MEALIERWYRHGKSVNEWYKKLLADPTMTKDEKAIKWFATYKSIDLMPYHYFHDCGKPFVYTVDENGKEHYPNHSQASHDKYVEMFGDTLYADLILHDMDFHKARGDEIIEVWNLPYSDHLYATAWAEIFANAEIFGGIESDSFKIKRRRLLTALKKLDTLAELA